MKIYTKKGDDGTTSLFGGKRLSKSHIRISSYGDVDELNSFIGLVRDGASNIPEVSESLIAIQDRLFTIGSQLATDPEKPNDYIPKLYHEDVVSLEVAMDKMDESLPEMRSFVLPGGHTVVSQCHIARCVCRRTERSAIELSANEPVNPLIIMYLNRLSDYLFVLSRYLTKQFNASEIEWKPKH